MRWWRRLTGRIYGWIVTEELADLDLRLRNVEYRLSLLHRLLTVMEEPTLDRAVSAELCNVVQMRQEVVKMYREAQQWEST